MSSKKSNIRKADILQLLLSLAAVLLVTFIGSLLFFKLDLTEEKRHSLTDATEQMLESLEDQVFVKVYLHGDFPANFKRLEQAVRERLDEFRDLSDDQVEYEFIDIYESGDKTTIAQNEKKLFDHGLRFTRISYEENGVKIYQMIWPAALLTYQGTTYPIQFFKSENPDPTDAMLNTSINNLEYELASKMNIAMREEVPRIAFLEGHGELEPIEVADLSETIAEDYIVERVKLDGKLNALSDKLDNMRYRINKFDLLIVAKPDSVFSNQDKVILDQFVMNGGKVLWMIDPILTDLDSLSVNQQTIGVTNEVGLYDMLFDYGVRLNRNLVVDYSSAPIVFDAGPMGNQRNVQVFSWYFAPIVLATDSAHPIAANLDPIHFDYVSSLDTVGESTSIKKSVLLASSPYSRNFNAPVRINSSIVNFDLEYFKKNNKPNQALAVLLEGRFKSNFQDRLSDTIRKNPDFAFRAESAPTKMIVIGDGDIARNKVMPVQGGYTPMPLGYDRYAGRVVYDNKEFLLNAINYLLDDNALISVRSRTIELRKLNAAKIKEQKGMWQVINVAVPLVLLVIFGWILSTVRRKHYAINQGE